MNRVQVRTIITVIVIYHLSINVCVGWAWWQRYYFDDAWQFLIAVGAGICVGQLNLIAIWFALVPERLVVRLPWLLLIVTLVWCALIVGGNLPPSDTQLVYFGATPQFPINEAVTVGVALIIGLIVTTVPMLWIVGKSFRVRLLPPCGDADSRGRQYSIAEVLLGIFLVSIALAIGRVVLPPGDFSGFAFDREVMVILIAISIVNLLVVTPCVLAASLKPHALVVSILVWPIYCIVVSGIESAIVSAFLPPGDEHLALILGIFNLAQCVSVVTSLLLIRGIGFRLIRLADPDTA